MPRTPPASGGVAGISKSTIRESCAKGRLSGAKQVGGIVGSGATIENCRAMVMIDNAAEQIGAIAGIVDDPLDGSVTGNTFVDGGVAGIDSVSYQGIAEPLAYEDFVAQENLPGDFGSICVRFVTDEDSLVQEYHIPYGSDFPTDQLPPVPNHQGQYGSWEDVDLTGMTFDATIHAEYNDINTGPPEPGKSAGERSLVLVEGSFDTTDELMLHEVDDAPETPGHAGGGVGAWSCPGRHRPHAALYAAGDDGQHRAVGQDRRRLAAGRHKRGRQLSDLHRPRRYDGLRRCADARQQGAPARGGLRRRSRTAAGDFVHRPQEEKEEGRGKENRVRPCRADARHRPAHTADASHKKAAAAQKPVLQRLFISAAFYKHLKNLSAVLIHAERKFGVPLHSPDEPFIRQTYGLRQSILRDGHSRQPRAQAFTPHCKK